ncbi:Prolamin-like domain [Dillenia turbinata]|uniref:Prolamin-like domain n=1 Tax=Dillenia turbinata TaxID=194707 RepID=A0AAN8Z1C5_9MAGN
MARSNNLTLILFFLAHSALLITLGLGQGEPIDGVVVGNDDVPADTNIVDVPTTDFTSEPPTTDFLENCIKSISVSCGNEIYHTLFGYVNPKNVSGPCCEELVKVGKKCYDALVNTVIDGVYDGSDNEKEEYRKRGDQAYKICFDKLFPILP